MYFIFFIPIWKKNYYLKWQENLIAFFLILWSTIGEKLEFNTQSAYLQNFVFHGTYEIFDLLANLSPKIVRKIVMNPKRQILFSYMHNYKFLNHKQYWLVFSHRNCDFNFQTLSLFRWNNCNPKFYNFILPHIEKPENIFIRLMILAHEIHTLELKHKKWISESQWVHKI